MAGTSIYLLAGMAVKLKAPVDPITGEGYFPREGTIKLNGVDKKLIKGFVVDNEDVGTIEDSKLKEVSVKYEHKKSLSNAIYFFSATFDNMAVVSISAVPIHDHSSVVQGGPAYGTYFSDDEQQT